VHAAVETSAGLRPSARRLAVFAAALLPRLGVAFLTFGAVDAVHNFRNFLLLIAGREIVTPYLPGVELVLWLEGLLGYRTALPVMFAWKLLPVVCDALIALVLYDAAADSCIGTRRALLYAFAPVPVYICAIHPQWDSLFLYPLLLALIAVEIPATRAAALAGAAVVVSVIAKPVAAPLVLFLFPHLRRRVFAFAGGALATLAAYAAAVAATGLLPTLTRLRGVVQYAEGGVQVFGLAVRPHDRLIPVAAALAIVAFVYFRGRCSRNEAVLLFFAITLGLSGLSIQYLCWIVPFAVLCGRTRFLTLYSVVAGTFCVFYYQAPVVNLPHVDDLGAYGLLHPFGAFGPPLPPLWIRDLLRIDGNILLPLLLIGFAALRIGGMIATRDRAAGFPPDPHLARYAMPAAALLVALALGAVWAAMQPRVNPDAYVVRIEQKIAAYDVVRYRGPSGTPGTKVWIARSLAEPGVAHRVLNATTFALVAVLLSAVAPLLPRKAAS
jgi:hypothetical protein